MLFSGFVNSKYVTTGQSQFQRFRILLNQSMHKINLQHYSSSIAWRARIFFNGNIHRPNCPPIRPARRRLRSVCVGRSSFVRSSVKAWHRAGHSSSPYRHKANRYDHRSMASQTALQERVFPILYHLNRRPTRRENTNKRRRLNSHTSRPLLGTRAPSLSGLTID